MFTGVGAKILVLFTSEVCSDEKTRLGAKTVVIIYPKLGISCSLSSIMMLWAILNHRTVAIPPPQNSPAAIPYSHNIHPNTNRR